MLLDFRDVPGVVIRTVLKGWILILRSEPEQAVATLRKSLTIARDQRAKSWELRAATCLAGLLRDQTKRNEAHDLLAPIYAWFTEGFDTRDLKDAKALLAEL